MGSLKYWEGNKVKIRVNQGAWNFWDVRARTSINLLLHKNNENTEKKILFK